MVRLLRVCLAVSATALVVGLLWSSYSAMLIRGGLSVLVAIPVLNLFGVIAGAAKQRDWPTVSAVVVVLVILASNVVWMLRLHPK